MPRLGWSQNEIYMVAERGHALHLQGRYREAVVVFEGLVAADPQNAYCRESLAVAWLALGEPKRSIDQLDILLTRDPSDLALRSRRLEAYLLAGDFSAAVRDFEYLRNLLPASQVRRLEVSLEGCARRTALEEPDRSIQQRW